MSSNDIPLSPFAGEAPGLLFGLPMPMSRAMALRGERIGNDRAQVRMGFQAEQSNSRGDVHGGAIASLLDCTLAGAARKPSRRCSRITLAAWLGPSAAKLSAQSRAESPPPAIKRFLPAKAAGSRTR